MKLDRINPGNRDMIGIFHGPWTGPKILTNFPDFPIRNALNVLLEPRNEIGLSLVGKSKAQFLGDY